MQKFLVRLVIFWLPIALPSLIIYGTGYYIGETMPLEKVVSMQQNSDDLIAFLPTWQQSDYINYKLLGAQAIQPDILVFGSSRMLYYSNHFLANGTLYNASVAGTAIDFQLEMLNTLIEAGTIPRVIILGIDLVSYNDSVPPFDPSRTNSVSLNFDKDYLLSGFRDAASLWFSGDMPNLISQSRAEDGSIFLGTEAITDQLGLIHDGSSYLPNATQTRIADNIARSQRAYENQETHFTHGIATNEANLSILNDFLERADTHGIRVIGLTQPFHPWFVDRMRDNPDFAYRPLAANAVETLFSDYDFPLYFFPDMESFGGTDDDFLDDWHYRQLAALKMFRIIAIDSQDLLSNHVDLAQLENDIAHTDNPYAVYYYPAP